MMFKMLKRDEIENEASIAWEKVWYDRHQVNMQNVRRKKEKNPQSIKFIKFGEKAAKKLEKKYGKKNLGPYTKFGWGMLNGRLETLNWVLGEDWGMLDT